MARYEAYMFAALAVASQALLVGFAFL